VKITSMATTAPGPGPVAGASDAIPWLTWFLWLAVGFFAIFPFIVAYMVWAERKVAGRFQDRIGPNRVGPFGLLQPIADALKLITKESIVPDAADRVVHLLAPVLMMISAFLVLAVIPFGFGSLDRANRLTGFLPADLPSGLLFLVAVSSLSPLGIFLAGWSSRNKFALLGGMRGVAQLVSYEIPQVLSAVPILLWAGSLSLVRIVDQQVDSGLWNVFIPPGFLAFGILLIASLAEVNRTPFDLPEAESEIIAGFHTEYSAMRFGLFFLAEYLNMFGVASLATTLFLGGGSLPFGSFPKSLLLSGGSVLLVNLIAIGIFLAKVAFFVFLMFWVRATLPRLRVDQLMNFAWKALVPLSLANVLIAAVWFEMALRPGGPGVLWAWLATAVMVVLTVYLAIKGLNLGLKTVPGARRRLILPEPTTAIAAPTATTTV
jgi:NADH-quinone oxidoreductase subunit H